ncbi:MAG: extracellular solute-binding protein [Paenibacillaceae bacterium]
MQKRLLVFLTLVLIVATVLAGCSNNSNNGVNAVNDGANAVKDNKEPSKDAAKPTKLVLWTFNALHQTFYEAMADQWNEKNPDKPITLEATTYPYDDMHNSLLVALQTGTGAPDIADVEISKFANYLKGEPQLVELNDVVEPELSNIVQSRVDIYAKDGKYYGIDFHIGAAVIYYNTELLDKAGVNADDIKTWADFEEAGKKVLAATGKVMTTLETTDQWSFWPLISQRGSDFLDKDKKVILDSQANIDTLTYLQNLVKQKIAVGAPGGGHHAEEYYGFMNSGESASVFMPFWYMGRFLEYMPDLKGKIAIKPMPAWEAGGFRSAGMGGTGTVVTKQSKSIDLAKQFAAFSKLSKEGNIEIWKQLGFDPIRTDVWDSPELKEANKFSDYFGDDIFDTLNEIKDEINAVNIGELTPAASDVVRSQVMNRAIIDLEDPAKVLKDAADSIR